MTIKVKHKFNQEVNTSTDLNDHGRHILLVSQIFEGVKDKGGNPYFNHIASVANNFELNTFEYIIALYHDVLEDTDLTSDDLMLPPFNLPYITVRSIETISRNFSKNKLDYINNVINDKYALNVKIADVKDNLRTERLNRGLTVNDVDRCKEYAHTLFLLEKVVDLDFRRGDNITLIDDPNNFYDKNYDGYRARGVFIRKINIDTNFIINYEFEGGKVPYYKVLAR